MNEKINYIEHINTLIDFYREIEHLVDYTHLNELSIDTLENLKNEYVSLKSLNDELFVEIEKYKDEFDKEIYRLASNNSKDLNSFTVSRIELVEEEIKLKSKVENEEKPYTISDDIINIFYKNQAIKAKTKNEFKSYSNRKLTEEEYNNFISLIANTLLSMDTKNKYGIVNQNVLFNFEKNAYIEKLKTDLKPFMGKHITQSNIKYLKEIIFKNFVEKKDLEENKNTKKRETKPKKDAIDKVAPAPQKPVQNNKKPNLVQNNNIKLASNSIQSYIDNGVLPNNIKESKLIEICNLLGINATDLSFTLTDEQLERLNNDKVIVIAKNNQEVVNSHNEKINKYKELIAKYENILNSVNSKRFSDEFKKKINTNLIELKAQKNVYEKLVSNIKYDSTIENFDLSNSITSDIDSIKAQSYDKKASRFNEKLRKEYQDFDKLNKQKQMVNSKLQKARINRRINKKQEKIEKLKKKQGIMSQKQIKIVNENTLKYINTIEKWQQKYLEKEMLSEKYINEINNIEKQINNTMEEKAKVNQDLSLTNDINKKDRRSLERENTKLQKQIDRLKAKQGFVDLRFQFANTKVRTR